MAGRNFTDLICSRNVTSSNKVREDTDKVREDTDKVREDTE